MKNVRRTLAVIFILTGITIFYFVKSAKNTPVFSPYTLLTTTWDAYKRDFIDKDGKVTDTSQGNISTSEGQSYAMLRSVYIDDKDTFDKVWHWTIINLKKGDSNLFGWKWGKIDNARYGFLPGGGDNTASDADQDIALALIFAYKRWNQPEYLNDAKKIIDDIWVTETATVLQKRYLVAGNWAQSDSEIIINPSYFAPYAWRIFGQVDKKHDWESLVDPAYEILLSSGFTALNKEKGIGLPPDWLAIKRDNAALSTPSTSGLTTDYSFDAMRTPFRIALDYLWFNEESARTYLKSSYIKLGEDYGQKGKISLAYAHDGTVVNDAENPAMYATSLGYFLVADKDTAKKVYDEKIINLYSNKDYTFKPELGYFEQNWLWFGAALYNNFLENLYI